MSRPIIIDTDPGIDDAVAILLALASSELAVLGLLAVAGNLPVAATAKNALRVVELAGRPEIPVFAGCPRPIGARRAGAEHVHGASGLGGLVLPEPAAAPRPEHGVVHLIERLRKAAPESITLCALGPLTNIATALVMAPDIAGAIGELVVMGGGTHGNVTPAAEFNIHQDPQAAAIVFDAGLPITLVPLDVTELTDAAPPRLDAIRAVDTRCADTVAAMLTPLDGEPGRPARTLHDPCVIAYLLAPGLFHAGEAHVAIDTDGKLTAGMTVIDRRGRNGRAYNARILDRIDVDGFYRLLAERLAALP